MKTLKQRAHPASDSEYQLKVLNGSTGSGTVFPDFSKQLELKRVDQIRAKAVRIFQVNVGYMCNQTCRHCHVDAGPDRKEIMTRQTMEKCLTLVERFRFPVVDITGGAPEMNPHFRWFVEQLTALGSEVINRCNLTIILANPNYRNLPDFFAQHRVHLISSLPFYSASRTDAQRGNGVFEKSIEALKLLNEAGYGLPQTGLKLDLVYNPSGAFLPASQQMLEVQFKKELAEKWQVHFNNLLVMTNMPVSRFLEYLLNTGNYEEYMQQLIANFNPAAAQNVMCRDTLSVGWNGCLYDCDFNQMLNIPIRKNGKTLTLNEFDPDFLSTRFIETANHCYGCTAGAGSSCGGQMA